MDGFSILDPLAWDPEAIKLHPAYAVGNAASWLSKSGAAVGVNHYLSGRLYVSKSGWLLLSVPNALVRGVFDAMSAPGVELPTAGKLNVPNAKPELLNAHISVMTAEEVSKIGADKITERGHMFHYALGPIKEITPKNIDGISKVWAVQVASPELAALRKSYGLSALPNEDHSFHITVAVRRAGVLLNNAISKSDEMSAKGSNKPTFHNPSSRGEFKAAGDVLYGGKADNKPDATFPAEALAEGKKHEREHTGNDQIAKEIAKDHLQDDPAYYEKVKAVEKDAGSVYVNQAMQMFNPSAINATIQYDHNKPVFENIKNQLAEVKRRGDFLLQTRRNHDIWRSQLDPHFRYQRAMQAFRGELPQPGVADQLIERYGDGALNSLSFGKK